MGRGKTKSRILFDEAKQSLKDGNWEEFGVKFTELEKEIEKLRGNETPAVTEKETEE